MPENKVLEDVSQEPRIGAYVCHCGGNISGAVQCDLVARALGKLPNVTVTRTDESLCSDAGQSRIEQDIKEFGLNRVVVGACAPMLHEQTFRGAVTRAGLNPFLYHHVGLREQNSWVHAHDPQAATEKAYRLMAAGIAKARLLQPLDSIRLGAEKHALVIGGGVAGLRAALDIARQGLQVTLVEKSPFLGGRMAQLGRVFPTGEEAHSLLRGLIEELAANPNVTLFTQAEVASVSGYVGNFHIQIRQHSRGVNDINAEVLMAACTQKIPDEFNYGLVRRKVIYRPYAGCYPTTPAVDWEHFNGEAIRVDGRDVVLQDEIKTFDLTAGAVVMSTGFDPYSPPQGEYGYGELPQVITLPQLIRLVAQAGNGKHMEWKGRPIHDVALLHCVGSRQIEGVHAPQADGQVNNYCSRVCCTASLHILEELHQQFPDITLYDLHQDIRTYGRGHEDYYRRTLDKGVRFLRYHSEEPPVVSSTPAGDTHPVLVKVKDALTFGQEIEIPVDLVVLAVGMLPRQIDDLVKMLKVSRGTDRFLLEVHPKLRPVETAVNGVVLAGTAQGPMNIQESLSAAAAAAAKVAALLSRGRVDLPPFVASVDTAKCTGTGACVKACEYEGAISLQTFQEDGKQLQRAVVTPANCVGCGACVSVCPNGAIDVQGWTLAQYEAMVAALGMEISALTEAGS
jgi:heterodisulfide reductase subunit A2